MFGKVNVNWDVGLGTVVRMEFLKELTGDILTISESFVLESSLLDLARFVQESMDGARIIGVDSDTILVKGANIFARLCLSNGGVSPVAAVKSVVYVEICGRHDDIEILMKKIELKYRKHKQSFIALWHIGRDQEPTYNNIFLEPYGEYHPEFYPWITKDYLQKYYNSSCSVLFFMGPPGTGKTSVLRNWIVENNLNVMVTYDEKILENDQMFLSLITSTEMNVLIVEDADDCLTSRERGKNHLISRFLNYSDGLAKQKKKKIIFTTNLGSFERVDPALVRQGRCFGAVKARLLDFEEAVIAAERAGVERPPVRKSYSIAEIFAGNYNSNRGIEVGSVGFR